MAKRHASESSSKKDARIADSDSLKSIERQVIAIAEELGRIAGAVQARTDGWLNQRAFQTRLARIRNRASKLLSRLGANGSAVDEGHARARVQSRAKVAAPGKKHRKAPEPSAGVEPSQELNAKAIAARRRNPPHPRQG
jgi:hypothetical protein